jgi:hypothetical protein
MSCVYINAILVSRRDHYFGTSRVNNPGNENHNIIYDTKHPRKRKKKENLLWTRTIDTVSPQNRSTAATTTATSTYIYHCSSFFWCYQTLSKRRRQVTTFLPIYQKKTIPFFQHFRNPSYFLLPTTNDITKAVKIYIYVRNDKFYTHKKCLKHTEDRGMGWNVMPL